MFCGTGGWEAGEDGFFTTDERPVGSVDAVLRTNGWRNLDNFNASLLEGGLNLSMLLYCAGAIDRLVGIVRVDVGVVREEIGARHQNFGVDFVLRHRD